MIGLLYELWQSVMPITRTILIISLSLSLMVTLDLCTPYKLYFNYSLIKSKGQWWRPISSLFYYGNLSAHTIFSMLMFCWYSNQLESIDFRTKP